ncbi:hypothetical protein KBY76_00345 [Synechococcus sp. GreenBA-s]|nr:hypothetical protein [Synechococcus sp. GreenBA-s]
MPLGSMPVGRWTGEQHRTTPSRSTTRSARWQDTRLLQRLDRLLRDTHLKGDEQHQALEAIESLLHSH